MSKLGRLEAEMRRNSGYLPEFRLFLQSERYEASDLRGFPMARRCLGGMESRVKNLASAGGVSSGGSGRAVQVAW